jgi:O-antigen/teichoic acid export membrane protein
MSLMRKAAGNTAVYGAGFMIDRGIAFLLVALYARLLREDGAFAMWDLCAVTILLLSKLFALALAPALLRLYHSHEGEETRRGLYSTLLFCSLGLCAVLCTLAVAFQSFWSGLIFGDPSHGGLVVLVALSAAFTIIAQQPLSLLRAQERPWLYSALSIARALLGPGAILLFMLYFDMGIAGALLGDLVGLAVLAAAGLIATRRWIAFRFRPSLLREGLRFGLPIIPSDVALLALLISDRYFLRRWVGLGEEMDLFSLATRISMAIMVLTRAFQLAWPATAFQLAKEDDAHVVYARMFRYVLAAFCASAITITAFAPELVHVFGGDPAYRPAYVLIPGIVISYILYGLSFYVMTALAILKRTGPISAVVCASAAVKIGLNVVLVPQFGVSGAVAASVGAFAFQLAIGYYASQKLWPVPYERTRIAAVLSLTAAAAVGAAAAGDLPMPYGLPLRLGILIMFGVFAGAAGLSGADRHKGRTLLRRILRPLRQQGAAILHARERTKHS